MYAGQDIVAIDTVNCTGNQERESLQTVDHPCAFLLFFYLSYLQTFLSPSIFQLGLL